MKRINAKAMLLGIMMICMAQTVNAQNEETTMQDIHQTGMNLIEYLEEKQNQEIVRIEYDLVFTKKETTRYLYEDFEYQILGFADRRVEDLDITVYKKLGTEWIQVAKDTDADSSPMLTVKPTSSREYKIEVSVYKFKEGYSAAHYGLIICHDIPE
jgi:hypothetical protein